MNQQTKVHRVELKRAGNEEKPVWKSTAEWTEVTKPERAGKWMLQADRLLRNLAVAGALLLVVVAVRNTGAPEAQSVFSALQSSMNAEWDESVGKLSFVNSLLPPSLQAVWSEREDVTVFEPLSGETVHAWSKAEPYIEIAGTVAEIRAVANGEVMSIAHGLEEERIVRIRHDDETESVYGNLEVCYAEVGDRVLAGDVIARVAKQQPLAFELRKDGRSINPDGYMIPQAE